MWRYSRFRIEGGPRLQGIDFLWDTLGAVAVPVMLVRGMRPQSVVDHAHDAAVLRRLPGARIEHVADAGHSIQGDAPVELAGLIADFVR